MEASILWKDDILFYQSLSTYRLTYSTVKRSLLYQNFQSQNLPVCGILVYKDDVFVALTSTYGLALVVVAAMAATRTVAPATLEM